MKKSSACSSRTLTTVVQHTRALSVCGGVGTAAAAAAAAAAARDIALEWSALSGLQSLRHFFTAASDGF